MVYDIEEQLKSIIVQIRSLNDEIKRIKSKENILSDQFRTVLEDFIILNKKFDESDFLEKVIIVENGEKKRKTVRELLVENYRLIEPIRLFYDFTSFLRRHKIFRRVFYFANIFVGISILGYALTGKGFLQLIGFLE